MIKLQLSIKCVVLLYYLNLCCFSYAESPPAQPAGADDHRLPIYGRIGYSRDHYNFTENAENGSMLNRIDKRLSSVIGLEQAQVKKMDSLETKINLLDAYTQQQTTNLRGELNQLSQRVQRVETTTHMSQATVNRLSSKVNQVRVQLGANGGCTLTCPTQNVQNISTGTVTTGGTTTTTTTTTGIQTATGTTTTTQTIGNRAQTQEIPATTNNGANISVENKLNAIATLLHSTRVAVDQVQKSVGKFQQNMTNLENTNDRIQKLQQNLADIQKNVAQLQGTQEQITGIQKSLNQLRDSLNQLSKSQQQAAANPYSPTGPYGPTGPYNPNGQQGPPASPNKPIGGGNNLPPKAGGKPPAPTPPQTHTPAKPPPKVPETKPTKPANPPNQAIPVPGKTNANPTQPMNTGGGGSWIPINNPMNNPGNNTMNNWPGLPTNNNNNNWSYPPTFPPLAGGEQLPCSCAEVSGTQSGIYRIQLRNGWTTFVQCDLETNSNKWTVIMNRCDGTTNFFRNWDEYRNGFGNIYNEFWIGLENLYQLTSQALHELLIELEDFNGETRYARYNNFGIGNENQGYPLNLLGQYFGNAGDSLSYHAGQKFSTFDIDNDGWPSGNCAQSHMGGWWYKACDMCNLGGKYLGGQTNDMTRNQGMYWNEFGGPYYSLRRAKMMIRQLM